MFQSSVTDFNFGTETCDTSKYWKRWMVGRWMEPTESLVLCSKSFFSSSIFQIICLQRSRQLWYFHFSFLQRSQLKKWSQNHSLHDSRIMAVMILKITMMIPILVNYTKSLFKELSKTVCTRAWVPDSLETLYLLYQNIFLFMVCHVLSVIVSCPSPGAQLCR